MDDLSLDEELSQRFDELNNDDTTETSTPTEDPGPAESSERAEGAGEEAEVPEGEEAAGEQESPGESARKDPEKGSEKDPDPEKGEGAEKELEAQYSVPPSSWDKESKENYKDLPDWMKRQAHKREGDIFKGIEKYKERAERFDPIINENKSFLDAIGATPEGALKEAINLAKGLRSSDPRKRGEILRNLAHQVGADMEVIKQEVPKEAQYLQQFLSPVMQKLNQLEQRQVTPPDNSADEVVQQFQSEADGSGNPKFPFAQYLENEMVTYIPSLREQHPGYTPRQLLEAAYEKAVWADPYTRNHIQSEQTKKKEAERQAQAEARAKELEKANKSNLDKRGSHEGPAPTGTMDETLSAAYDELVGNI